MSLFSPFDGENIANPREFFRDDLICREYLSRIKWGDAYFCKKCSWKKYHTRPRCLSRVCNSCGTSESPTTGTIFYLLGFKINKGFSIVMDVFDDSREVSLHLLSKRYNITKKATRIFLEKLMKAIAMEDNSKHLFLRV